jgi:hypothetical protein
MAVPLKKAKKPAAAPAGQGPAPAKAAAPQPRAAGVPPAKQEDEFTSRIFSPVSAAWDLLRSGALSLYIPLLKLNLVRNIAYFICLALLLAVLAGAAIAAGPGAYAANPPAFLAMMGVILLGGGIIILWLMQTFESAAYVLVAAKAGNKPYSMRAALGDSAPPTFRYALLDAGLRLLVLLPLALILVAGYMSLSPLNSLPSDSARPAFGVFFVFAYVLFIAYIFLSNLLYEFAAQFWRYGFLIEKRPVVQSLKRGLGLIRESPFEVLLFGIIYAAVFLVSSVPSFFYGIVMYFAVVFVQIAAILVVGPAGYIVYAAAVILAALVGVVFSTITETVCRPLHYMFWKRLSQGRN